MIVGWGVDLERWLAQWVGVHFVFTEDIGSLFSTHIAAQSFL